MNFSKIFIDRPVATCAIMGALLLAGLAAFPQLPVAPLPQVEFPTISVSAVLPGADAETMASSVAAPLERQFAQITGLTQITSSSGLSSTNISLQFSLNRNIDAAAQDVQAAISAAGGQLPRNLPNPPTYKKTNPSEQPILIIGVWSDVLPLNQVDDYADTVLAQKISQVPGVGQVGILGEQKRAMRIQVDPAALASAGISLEDVRSVLTQANVKSPKGTFDGAHQSSTIDSNDQLVTAQDYNRIVVAYRNGAPVHISDIGAAVDSVENTRVAAWVDHHPGILLAVSRQPGANIIEAGALVKAELPKLRAAVPPAIHVELINDRTQMIRASVKDIEITLVITIALVIMVIFLFLRKLWATVIPAIAVPLSLIGTFGVMYLLNYSVDNLSLMALTIAVGFVVDDAIVMIENIVRYIEQGETPYRAAVKGASQIGFTIVAITVSLIAVFIPLLLMGGIVGRLFHEFAITVAVAVLISAFISLTLTPMMCARFLGHEAEHQGWLYRMAEQFFDWMAHSYGRLLRVVLRHQAATLATFIATITLSGVLFAMIPKGFFPQQDTGTLQSAGEAAQDVSFADMKMKQRQVIETILQDPDVLHVPGFVGGGFGGATVNSGRSPIVLKPFGERSSSADEIIARLRPKLAKIVGYKVFLQSDQDIKVGARFARTQFQYTLQDADVDELSHWSAVMFGKLRALPQLQDVATDLQDSAARTMIRVDRETASRLGVLSQQIDDTLYDAFGQRQVGTMFTQLNQYRVILEIDPRLQAGPDSLSKIYVKSANGKQVPLSAFTTVESSNSALSINHQGQFPSVTLSFNLAPGVALGQAVDMIERTQTEARMPISVVATFQGTAQAFQASLTTMPYLIGAALIAVYLVLSVLYESFIHPLTILSTIPSAGVGALLALNLTGHPLDMMALIGIILLIGIVKKNAIMMIDFALEAERHQGMLPQDAIYHAALLRFRPIMMTTMAALLSGVTLMANSGPGWEFRYPLGVAIVGGLILSQALTLFTTPVVYLYLDRLSARVSGRAQRVLGRSAAMPASLPAAE